MQISISLLTIAVDLMMNINGEFTFDFIQAVKF